MLLSVRHNLPVRKEASPSKTASRELLNFRSKAYLAAVMLYPLCHEAGIISRSALHECLSSLSQLKKKLEFETRIEVDVLRQTASSFLRFIRCCVS